MSLIGYYITCDDAICADCAPKGFASGDYSEWPGFESWPDPIIIFTDSEGDTITHCCDCGAVIRHNLTVDGWEALKSAVVEYLTDPESQEGEIIAQWWDAYGEDQYIGPGMIEQLLERRMEENNA